MKCTLTPLTRAEGGKRIGPNIQFDENGLSGVGFDAKVLSGSLDVDGERVKVSGGACVTVVCGSATVKGNPGAAARNVNNAILNVGASMQTYQTATGTWYADIMAVFGIPKSP